MSDSTALDLLKSLATDHGFRSQLQSLDAHGKRVLLQRCGFGTLTASDMRTAAASVFGAQVEAAQSVAPTASRVTITAASTSLIETVDGRVLTPTHVAASASLIETVDGRVLTPTHVAASASAIETADGRALAFVHVAGSASAIETVDGHVMASLTANSGHGFTSAHQKAA